MTRIPLSERFALKVDRRGPDACWPWLGARNGDGYGVIRGEDGRLTTAHRAAMVIDGRDPGPLNALHSCDTPWCVNPAHLSAGTHAQNLSDMAARGRSARGRRNGQARLTDRQVRAIRRLAPSTTRREIAARFGVSETTVTLIILGQTWRHLLPAAA